MSVEQVFEGGTTAALHGAADDADRVVRCILEVGMAIWRIRLNGERGDLRDLVEHFRYSDIQVTEMEQGFYLTAAVLNDLSDPAGVLSETLGLLSELKAITVLDRGYTPDIDVAGVEREEPDRPPTQFIIGVSSIPSGARFGTLGLISSDTARLPAQPTPTERIRAASARYPKIKQTLRLFGAQDPTWDQLYRVFEIVEEDVGRGMITKGWITRKEKTRFTQTANHYRHSKENCKLPSESLSLPDARALLRRLVRKWIDSKSETL